MYDKYVGKSIDIIPQIHLLTKKQLVLKLYTGIRSSYEISSNPYIKTLYIDEYWSKIKEVWDAAHIQH